MIYAPIILWAIIMACSNASAADTDVYTTQLPKTKLTKVEALKALIVSDNKKKVYRCREVKVSDKGTVRYR